MVTEGDVTVGHEHTMQYTDGVLQSCTLETYNFNEIHPSKFNKNK